MLRKLLQSLTYPYRAGVNFVDTRPSASQIKQHLAQVEPNVVENPANGACTVSLVLKGTDNVVVRDLMILDTPNKDANMQFASGLAKGFTLAQETVANLRRSECANQQALLKRLQRQAKASAKATAPAETPVSETEVISPDMGNMAHAGI